MLKIVSGAQTGVDRAALDAALSESVPCGGWCPEGRKAEDGIIPEIYPVQELAGGDYADRTRKNVQDSDGTVIIYFGYLRGGTEKTLRFCLDEGKPYLLIDAQEINTGKAARRIAEFFTLLGGETINVAGPRASHVEMAYDYTLKTIREFISLAL